MATHPNAAEPQPVLPPLPRRLGERIEVRGNAVITATEPSPQPSPLTK